MAEIYQSIYSGPQIDAAIGRVYENKLGALFNITSANWVSANGAYTLTLEPNNFGEGVVFASGGMDLAFYGEDGERYYFSYISNNSSSITVKSNINIKGTFYLYYGAQQKTVSP